IAVVATMAMGSAVGLRPGGLLDRGLRGFSLLGIAVPHFLLGLLLILFFAIWLPWFPAGGYRTSAEVGVGEMLSYLVLPAVALGISLMCQQMRTFRASLATEYEADYVPTARKKGSSRHKHISSPASHNSSSRRITVLG